MDGRLPLPLLLDGATATNLSMMGMPMNQCHEEWMLDHPKEVKDLLEQFIQAGAQMIYTPTHTANVASLSRFQRAEKVHEYNLRLGRLAREAAGDHLVAGCVGPYPTMEPQPNGETEFLDIVNAYADQAFALKEAGVDLFIADCMVSLAQCRAAIFGCRQTGLPVMVTVTVDEEGETSLGCNLVSALVVCQSLGATAFGIACNSPQVMLEQMDNLAEFATIPLVAKPDAKNEKGVYLSPQQMAVQMRLLLERGARAIGGCCNTMPDHIRAMRRVVDAYPIPPLPEKNDIYDFLLANDLQTFYLSETFELSDDIPCGIDMADHLLEVEESGADVASIVINSVDDAVEFARNAHMLQIPVCFFSNSEEALEMALLLYNGRAIISAQSELEEDALTRIAKGYGAIIR